MHWYLAQLKPNSDNIAKRNLARQDFVTFQPLERCTRVRAGRFSTHLRGFFPGYLFVSHPDTVAPWAKINATYGIARLVSSAGKPTPVPSRVIAELQERCDDDGVMASAHAFAPGAQVEVRHGAFTDFLGEIERLTPDHRALVLIDFMGKQTRVTLRAADLHPLHGTRQNKVAAA